MYQGEANPMIEKMIVAAEKNATQVEGFDLTVLYPTSIRHVLAYSGMDIQYRGSLELCIANFKQLTRIAPALLGLRQALKISIYDYLSKFHKINAELFLNCYDAIIFIAVSQ